MLNSTVQCYIANAKPNKNWGPSEITINQYESERIIYFHVIEKYFVVFVKTVLDIKRKRIKRENM